MSDLIKRSDAIEVAYQLRRKPNDEEWDWWVRSFNAIPSADRPQGEWIAKTENYHSHWVCSECGAWALLEYNEQMCLSKFCPNCGARMKGADDAD